MSEREVTPEAMNVMLDQMEATQEEAEGVEVEEAVRKQREAQFEEMVIRLMANGFTRRNAKRFIIAQSKKQYAKFVKQAKANMNKPKPHIELTPEELAEENLSPTE
jgi:formate dehydrogenase maturation protein FdhE